MINGEEGMIDVWEALGVNHRLHLNTVDGVLWASNSYWAVAVDDKGKMAGVLREFGVPLAPGVFMVGRSIQPISGEPGDLAMLVADRPELHPISSRKVNDQPVYIRDDSALELRWHVLIDLPEGNVGAFDSRFVDLCQDLAPGEWYGTADPFAAIYRIHEGRPTAMLKGVRHPVTGLVKA